MTTQNDELAASLAELEAMQADAPDEMRPILAQQIASMRETLRLLASVTPVEREPVALTPDEQRFFATRAPVEVPAWLPDDLRRESFDPELLRCPPEARVYDSGQSVGCAISADGHGIPEPHGLTIGFHHDGALAYQRCYDHGLLRWAIEYYVTGGRETVGLYCDREAKVHLEEGLHTRWSPGGQIIAQTEYRDGVRHGWSCLWEDDGTPIVATQYSNGVADQDVRPGYVDAGR